MTTRAKLKLDEHLFISKCMTSFNCFNMKYNSIAPKTTNLGKVVQSLCSPSRIWGKVYHSYIIHIGFEFTLIAKLVFNSYMQPNKFLKIYLFRFCENLKTFNAVCILLINILLNISQGIIEITFKEFCNVTINFVAVFQNFI